MELWNRCSNSKENTWSWNINFANFKQRNDIMKIVQALEDSDISSKKIAEKIENETKERKAGFLGM